MLRENEVDGNHKNPFCLQNRDEGPKWGGNTINLQASVPTLQKAWVTLRNPIRYSTQYKRPADRMPPKRYSYISRRPTRGTWHMNQKGKWDVCRIAHSSTGEWDKRKKRAKTPLKISDLEVCWKNMKVKTFQCLQHLEEERNWEVGGQALGWHSWQRLAARLWENRKECSFCCGSDGAADKTTLDFWFGRKKYILTDFFGHNVKDKTNNI